MALDPPVRWRLDTRSEPTITFDALPGSVSASEDGGYPRTPGADATLNGTIACG